MKKRMIALVLAVLVLMLAAMPAMATRNYRSTGNSGCYETDNGSGSGERSGNRAGRAGSYYNHQDYYC